MLQIESIPVGVMEVNCYLVQDDDTGNSVIIDPGDQAGQIRKLVKNSSTHPVAILLTHGHFDHIGVVSPLAEHFDIPVYLPPDDLELYYSPDNAMPPMFPPVPDLTEPITELPELGSLTPEIIPTPGHTPGGVCYHFPEIDTIVSGDTLFRRGIGRTDLGGGNMDALLESIREKLFALPDRTAVCPGHGPQTDIGSERKLNPFLRERAN